MGPARPGAPFPVEPTPVARLSEDPDGRGVRKLDAGVHERSLLGDLTGQVGGVVLPVDGFPDVVTTNAESTEHVQAKRNGGSTNSSGVHPRRSTAEYSACWGATFGSDLDFSVQVR